MAERKRLIDDSTRIANWKRWGPYLSERQWGTVREDYSENGDAWNNFTHDQSRSRAYRWGEDGILGFTDRECRLCFSIALWNRRDPILKERLYGVTGAEGNHGEDVKEDYYYIDSTPTHSYAKGLYKYPQTEYPYSQLLHENAKRGKKDPEYELTDTGVFDGDRYFDVFVEYAKDTPDVILIRITVVNRNHESAELDLIPTLWFRNTWSWHCTHEGCTADRPSIRLDKSDGSFVTNHVTLRRHWFTAGDGPDGNPPTFLFTENETNKQKLWGSSDPNEVGFFKDAFHEYLIHGNQAAINPKPWGTKLGLLYRMSVAGHQKTTIKLALFDEDHRKVFHPISANEAHFDQVFSQRIQEADEFYDTVLLNTLSPEEKNISRQSYAGLLWTKQFYHYVIENWMDGDPSGPEPPQKRKQGRNREWKHLFARDVFSMPDKWEYPWFAAWDLAFHMVAMCRIDPYFAKEQLNLLLREWYMHPNGQIPAYEWSFSDVNPPVHAWASYLVFKITALCDGEKDRHFLESIFQKLLINFTWWVNRKDEEGNNIFSGGFLGLDNIGGFDRSQPLPMGGSLRQADGTAWMGFYCTTMLAIALELAYDHDKVRPAYEDMASKFLEHFVQICDAMHDLGGTGLWHHDDGFYYDQISSTHSPPIPLKTRSMVGLLPLIAVKLMDEAQIKKLPGFYKRLMWFLANKKDLSRHITYLEHQSEHGDPIIAFRLLAIPSKPRLERVLHYMLDENEFLSDYGLRSLSKYHHQHPYIFKADGYEHTVNYVPGESDTHLFGGNSNWRGPIWLPVNFLIVEALLTYYRYYGDSFKIECPTGSKKMLTLLEVAQEIRARLGKLFLPDPATKIRPCHYGDARYRTDRNQSELAIGGVGARGDADLILFYEYFHGDNGKGLGASHQTGWTSLIVPLLEMDFLVKNYDHIHLKEVI